MRVRLVLVLAVASALVAVGCRGGDGGSGKDRKVDTGPVTAKLSIELSNVGRSRGQLAPGTTAPDTLGCTRSMPAACSGELACPTAKGAPAWHADACTYLQRHRKELFLPIPDDAMCTEQYGGPDRARVAGMVNGKAMSVELARTNGCEISRWDLHSPLWGVKPDTATSGSGALPGDSRLE